jgi:hypothetical protein
MRSAPLWGRPMRAPSGTSGGVAPRTEYGRAGAQRASAR